MTFQFHSVAAQQFSHLFGLSDDALKKLEVDVYYADSKPGYPCRVAVDSLTAHPMRSSLKTGQ
jgi:hypothetical protein